MVNETIHSIDECVAVADVETLVDIYIGVLRRLLDELMRATADGWF